MLQRFLTWLQEAEIAAIAIAAFICLIALLYRTVKRELTSHSPKHEP
jgi:hypothetical protein